MKEKIKEEENFKSKTKLGKMKTINPGKLRFSTTFDQSFDESQNALSQSPTKEVKLDKNLNINLKKVNDKNQKNECKALTERSIKSVRFQEDEKDKDENHTFRQFENQTGNQTESSISIQIENDSEHDGHETMKDEKNIDDLFEYENLRSNAEIKSNIKLRPSVFSDAIKNRMKGQYDDLLNESKFLQSYRRDRIEEVKSDLEYEIVIVLGLGN